MNIKSKANEVLDQAGEEMSACGFSCCLRRTEAGSLLRESWRDGVYQVEFTVLFDTKNPKGFRTEAYIRDIEISSPSQLQAAVDRRGVLARTMSGSFDRVWYGKVSVGGGLYVKEGF